ncbi:unnamed protein product [Cylicocyclus nassatus]|uniref:Uncharacterized protein n=1 Tax=Cylicocyclus nassatus TaxID=53992 RepID=A0AA36GNJ3_CYLNA|nr:unnamed protein product [Cylicocyclus nassatus]
MAIAAPIDANEKSKVPTKRRPNLVGFGKSKTEVGEVRARLCIIFRAVFYNLLEQLQSDLALGKVQKNDGVYMPQAGSNAIGRYKIYKEYDCELEGIAYKVAVNVRQRELLQKISRSRGGKFRDHKKAEAKGPPIHLCQNLRITPNTPLYWQGEPYNLCWDTDICQKY